MSTKNIDKDATSWGPVWVPKCPAPAPIGPIGERLLAFIDESLVPTYGDPARLRDEARVLSLAAVVDSPWNPTVARAAAEMFHAGRGSGEGATPASIRRRVELLLAPSPLVEGEQEQDRRAVLAAVLDLVTVMFMAGQRVHGDTGEPPIVGMRNTADALAQLVDVMSENLAADDDRARLAGYPKEVIQSAAFRHGEFIERQVAAWCPDAPPRPRRSRRVDPLDEQRAHNLAALDALLDALLDEPDEPDEPDEGGAAGGVA